MGSVQLTIDEILSNSFVVTGGGRRLEQFRATFSSAGLDPSLIREWRECRIENEGSMGNAVSQYSLVRFALQSKMPFLVVFEDDAVPSDSAKDDLVSAFENKPDDCLCLSLGWCQTYPQQETDIAKRSEFKRVYGSHAYALFGEKAYLEFISKWERNGRADVVLGLMDGSYKGRDPIFAQHTVEKSIHLPDGWTLDAKIEREADLDLQNRYSKAVSAIAADRDRHTIHVAYTIDVQGSGAMQFCDQLMVSVYTLKKSVERGWRIFAHIFYNNVPADTVRKIMALSSESFMVEFKPIGRELMSKLESCSRRKPSSYVRTFTGITFARFCLPTLLPRLGRVIYMDADTMVRSSVLPLWATDLGDSGVIGAPYGIVPEYDFYSGTIVMDLKRMRESGDVAKFLDYASKEAHRFYLPDQTSMNRYFSGRIVEIDSKWIFPPSPGEHDKAMWDAPIWHFYNGQKPYRINSDDAGKALVLWNNELANAESEIGE